MSDYSKSPLDLLVANQQKGYVGLHVEQGVPLLDRDLNLLHDLITATVRSVFTRYIGNGIPAGADGFAIQAVAAPQDFAIAAPATAPGTFLVGGIEVTIPATINYSAQPGVPALTTPTVAQPDPRTDIVYLDVSFLEIDSTTDSDLSNSTDIGMETSVRLKPNWVVRVAEGVPLPVAPVGHVYSLLAQLQRPRNLNTIDATMITDLRQSRLTVSDMGKRLNLIERLLLLPSFATPSTIPKSAAVGATVHVSGHNFALGTPKVFFGAVQAALTGTFTATDIPVIVPNLGAGTYSVSVVTDGGGPVTAADQFIVVGVAPPPPPTAPTLDPVNPFVPKSSSVGTTITITGTNFNQPGLTVSFDLTPAIINTSSGTQITVKVPNIPAGTHTITVTTSAGSIASPTQFTVV